MVSKGWFTVWVGSLMLAQVGVTGCAHAPVGVSLVAGVGMAVKAQVKKGWVLRQASYRTVSTRNPEEPLYDEWKIELEKVQGVSEMPKTIWKSSVYLSYPKFGDLKKTPQSIKCVASLMGKAIAPMELFPILSQALDNESDQLNQRRIRNWLEVLTKLWLAPPSAGGSV